MPVSTARRSDKHLFRRWFRRFAMTLRGTTGDDDNRLYSLVAFMVALFVMVLSVPIFQVWFKATWLPYWTDYLIVGLFVTVWALLLSVIWRLQLIESITNIFARYSR